ncbi:universal stress protein [Pseudomonas floridensis]|uniref:Universal stress protein n=1 Tax=Pseudomonas floridensis TaxID=1958950 RepID=A0A1X0N6M3_9PSED|nr:universal stress protein [Pseudomonas floridensis]ORC59237.1 universal stress protein [Pseudomonas floridensis]
MHKVLVPFDGSEHAMRALGYVIELSADLKKPLEVHLLNVQSSPIDYSDYLAPDMIEGVKAGLNNEGKRVLDDAIELLTAAGTRFQAHVDLGNVAEQVEAQVQRLGCDAVVMGTRGLGSVTGLLLGSVATRVIHEASVPVTLIK